MRTTLRYTLFLSILIAAFSMDLQAAATSNLQWVGFFNSEPWSEGDASNFSMVSDLSLLNETASRGKAGIVEVGKVFCEEVWAGDVWDGWTLRSDWQRCWDAFADLAAPLVASGHIEGFIILDEPVWNGVEVSEIATIATAIKADFPTTKVLVVEARPVFVDGVNSFDEPVDYDPIPADVDWIGFDCYSETIATVQSDYQTYLYPKMSAGQKAVIVPQAFGSEGNPGATLDDYDQQNVIDAEAYYQWAKTDSNVIGFVPWHWLSLELGSDLDRFWSLGMYWEIGARDMPLTNAKWQQIGSEIAVNNQPAVLADTSFMQGWDSFSDGDQLPSTYEYDPYWPTGLPTSAVSFSTAESYSGTTSLNLKSNGAKMRYCWGTNDKNSAVSRQWAGQSVQYFEFKVKLDEASTNLYFYPYRIWGAPCTFRIATWGFEMVDGGGSYVRLANMTDFIDNDWNKIKVKIDINDQSDNSDDMITVWLNDVEIYAQPFAAASEVTFNSVGFIQWAATNTYIDDISMWGEVGCGDWGTSVMDVDNDCDVDLYDFAAMASSWGNCTDPDDPYCDDLK
ncbi:MAG: hypothetical protein ACIAQZ_00895 [Sedimentisphaeraceae bacterium JB056]